ncbi:MAG TPA: AI-2E family transporter [Thermoanaerobaculia bacterium]|nr:AI-2E family transporter [Thermoanaerobaculia bacterium]
MPDRVEVRIPFMTLLKVALAFLLCVCVIQLWPVILMIIVAILLAVMLDPIVGFLERHRVRRGLGVAIVAIVLLALLVVVFAVLVPAMSRQLVELSKTLPQVEQSISQRFPAVAPYLKSLHGGPPPELKTWLTRGIAVGKYAIELVTALLFVLVVALYLLLEGRTAFEWLITLAPKNKRPRLRQTAIEVAAVMLAFTRGQAICCSICATWTFLLLTLLHIPAALPLAGMAFIADLLPVVGTIAMMVPAVMLALTAGPVKALLVFAGFLLYHVAESYFIIPKVYGSQLRLSTLTVILAIMIGGTLQGVAGAILILPFVAAYPIVERLWLRDSLPEDTVKRHEELAE